MPFTAFQISALITAVVSFLVGVFIYSQNRKSKVNLFWFLTSILISVWSISLFSVVFSTARYAAWIWQNVLDVSAILVPIVYLNFIVYFVHREKKFIRAITLSWIAGFILIILSFTDLFKTGISPKFDQNFWVDPGVLYFLFPLTFALFVFIAIFLLVKEYFQTNDSVFRQQIKYILIAQIVGFGGGITNFFPQIFNIYPFGNYLVALYAIFITYAILKHHLFNIRVIATELFTLALWIFLLVRTLLSENRKELLINSTLLIVIFFLGILLIRSVTKEVKQREKLENLTKQIERAYEVEKKAHQELKRLDEVKTQFIMATQHHLRTPLTAMIGYIDLIMGGTYGDVPAKLKEVILKFQASTNRLIRIVNEFLDISQFQLGREVLSFQSNVNIEPILKEIIEELQYEAKAKSIYINLESPESGLPEIKVDPEKLRVALFNIIDNGVKYTNRGGVTIKLQITDGRLRIAVKDTGIGMTKEETEGLFSRFFERGREAQKVFAVGRGIGLYITSQIVKAHGGRIWAESEGKNRGSTFYIELPMR